MDETSVRGRINCRLKTLVSKIGHSARDTEFIFNADNLFEFTAKTKKMVSCICGKVTMEMWRWLSFPPCLAFPSGRLL